MSHILPYSTLIIFGLCAYWIFFGLPSHQSVAFGTQTFTGRVQYVIDGDTLILRGHKPHVRLWGVNTPERDERGFQAASDHLEALTAGKFMKCVVIDKDKYNRTVGRCYLPNGLDISALMLDSGHAKEMLRFSRGYYSKRNKAR